MKVLVTGANGFLGKEVVYILKNNFFDVISTDIVGNVDIVGDLSNKKFVDSLPLVDVVVNCAAVQYVTKNIPFFCRKKFFYKNNIESAKNLSEKYKDINIFVYVFMNKIIYVIGDVFENFKEIEGAVHYSEWADSVRKNV